jgi:hypothetical protein
MMLRSFLIKSGLVTGFILLCLLTTGVTLAVTAPFHPGNIFFPLQDFSEQQVSIIYLDPVSMASYGLDLFERRIADLGFNTGTQYELVSLGYLNTSIDQATMAITLIPSGQGDDVRLRLLKLTQQASEKVMSLTVVPQENPTIFLALKTKIETLLLMVNTEEVPNSELSRITGISIGNNDNQSEPIPIAALAGGLIPFPAGSPGAIHAFYPLLGQHAILLCNTCHDAGAYIGTSDLCIDCHQEKLPNMHYEGECASCHTAISWKDIRFDHELVGDSDCASCHEDKLPAGHFSGQC